MTCEQSSFSSAEGLHMPSLCEVSSHHGLWAPLSWMQSKGPMGSDHTSLSTPAAGWAALAAQRAKSKVLMQSISSTTRPSQQQTDPKQQVKTVLCSEALWRPLVHLLLLKYTFTFIIPQLCCLTHPTAVALKWEPKLKLSRLGFY